MARYGLDPGADFLLAARDEVLLRLNRQQLPPLDLAMCVSALGKLRPHPGPFFHRTLLRYTGKYLPAIEAAGPQALALLVGGLGNLQATQQQVLPKAARDAGAEGSLGEEGDGGGDGPTAAAPELVAGLLRLLDARVEELKPQELANALAGLGKLRARPDAAFLARAAAAVERRLREGDRAGGAGGGGFAPSDLAGVAFGLRRMRFSPPASFVAAVRAWGLRVLGRVEARVRGGEGEGEDGQGGGRGGQPPAPPAASADAGMAAAADARDVGHVLNALVRVGAGSGQEGAMAEVLTRAADVLVEGALLDAAPLQSLAMAVGAFARFDFHPGAGFLAAAARAGLGPERGLEGGMPPQRERAGSNNEAALVAASSSALHTALLLQALARLGHEPTPAQVDGALARLATRLQELTPGCLFKTLYALAKWDPRGGAPLPPDGGEGKSGAGALEDAATAGRRAFLAAWSAQAPRRGLLSALTTPQLVVAAWALRALGYRVTPDARVRFRFGCLQGLGWVGFVPLGHSFIQPPSVDAPPAVLHRLTDRPTDRLTAAPQPKPPQPNTPQRAFRETLGTRALVTLTDTEAASLLHSLRGVGLDPELDLPPLLLLRGERALLASLAPGSLPGMMMTDPSSGTFGGTTTTTSGGRGGSGSTGPLPLHLLPPEFMPAPTVLALKRGQHQRRAMVTAPIFPSGPETTDEGPPPSVAPAAPSSSVRGGGGGNGGRGSSSSSSKARRGPGGGGGKGGGGAGRRRRGAGGGVEDGEGESEDGGEERR